MSGDKRKKKTQKNIKRKELSNHIAIRNNEEKKLCMLTLHENGTRMFVLQIYLFFSRHIALVWQGLNSDDCHH